MDVLYFVVLVGVLIFVHELGHFAWAKFFGVRVLRFSLGFGPRLIGFRRGETEYVLAAIPLGGYVRMFGESSADAVGPEEEERSFQGQPLWKKLIIVVAGPAMNLVFPIVLYFVVFLGDAELPPPVVGTVFPNTPAYGKLVPGDRILRVDGADVGTFYDVNRIVERSPGRQLAFSVDRGGETLTIPITPDLTRVAREPPELALYEDVGRIGIWKYQPSAVIGIASPSGPAAAARLRTFDVVVSAAGQPIDTWRTLERTLDANRGTSCPVTFLRPVRVDHALGGLVEMDVYEPRVTTLTPDPGTASGAERAGLESADLYVSDVTVGSPEHYMGLLRGDRLLTLDGRRTVNFRTFLEDLNAGRGDEHELAWRRGDEQMGARFRLQHERRVTDQGVPIDRYVVGMQHWVPMRTEPPTENESLLTYAVIRAFEKTWELTEVTVYTVIRLLQGRLSVDAIGGPLTIFEVAGEAAREGPSDYLSIMAFVSINLGLINLMPIPMLDGGHLIFFFFEGVSRRRLSPRVRQYASLAGLLVLIVLMVIAFKNDIERQWPELGDRFGSER